MLLDAYLVDSSNQNFLAWRDKEEILISQVKLSEFGDEAQEAAGPASET